MALVHRRQFTWLNILPPISSKRLGGPYKVLDYLQTIFRHGAVDSGGVTIMRQFTTTKKKLAKPLLHTRYWA